MNFTIGGVLAFFWVAVLFVFKRGKMGSFLIITTILSALFIDIGYVVNIYGIELTYRDFFMTVTVIYFSLILRKLSFKRKTIVLSLILLASIMISYLITVFSPKQIEVPIFSQYDLAFRYQIYAFKPLALVQQNAVSLMKLLVFLLFIICAWNSIINLEKKNILSKNIINWGIICLFIVGGIDLITRYFLGSTVFNSILSFIFGVRSSSQSTAFFLRGGLVGFQGLYVEPSHYASYAFLVGLYVLSQPKTKRILLYIIFTIIMLVLSTSLRGFISAFILVFVSILFIFIKSKKSLASFLSIIIILFLLGIFIYVFFQTEYSMYSISRIKGFLGLDDLVKASEGARAFSIKNGFKVLLKRPFFGVGLGTTSSTGFLSTILSNLGIFGTFIYFLVIFPDRFKITLLISVYVIILIVFLIGSFGLAFLSSPAIVLIPLSFYRLSGNGKC